MNKITRYALIVFTLCCYASFSQSIKGVEISKDPKIKYSVSTLLTDTVNNVLYAAGFYGNDKKDYKYFVSKYDGTQWKALGNPLYGTIKSLCMYKGELYALEYLKKDLSIFAMGNFPKIEGFEKKMIKWDGKKWIEIVSDFEADFNCMVEYKGDLYAGGYFPKFNDKKESLLKWDGSSWSAVPISDDYNGVYAMILYKDELYIGTSRKGVLKWDGAHAQQVGELKHLDAIESFGIYNNELYAGGEFIGKKWCSLKKWDGKQWIDMGLNAYGLAGGNDPFYRSITNIISFKGLLMAGGTFIIKIDKEKIEYILSWDGKTWKKPFENPLPRLNPNTNKNYNGSVNSFALYHGKLFIALENGYENPMESTSLWEFTY